MKKEPVDLDRHWRYALGVQEEKPPETCPLAQRFEAKLKALLFDSLEKTQRDRGISRGQLRQAKYDLQEEWHRWRKSGGTHAIPGNTGHRCLFEVYDDAYDRLELLTLSLFPKDDLIGDHDELVREIAAQATPPEPEVGVTPIPGSPMGTKW
jgi:hypothetical protein